MHERQTTQTEEVILESGSKFTGVRLENGVVVAFPLGKDPKTFDEYEQRVLAKLATLTGVESLLHAFGSQTQLLLPIGGDSRNPWVAPGSVHKNPTGDIIFLLHYGPA